MTSTCITSCSIPSGIKRADTKGTDCAKSAGQANLANLYGNPPRAQNQENGLRGKPHALSEFRILGTIVLSAQIRANCFLRSGARIATPEPQKLPKLNRYVAFWHHGSTQALDFY